MNLTFAPVYHNQENEKRKFKIGKFRELNIYGAEIADSTGEASGEAALFGGCDIFLMGLTEDEFLLKDTDKKALCDLIDTLATKLPKDRLISFKQMNFKGDLVEKKIEPRCEDIDGGKYQSFLQSTAVHIPNDISTVVNSDYYLAANYCQKARTAPKEMQNDEFLQKLVDMEKITEKKLRAIPEFFYVYNKSLGENYPTIGPSGAVWIFTMENLAKAILEKNPAADLRYKKVDAKQMCLIVADMYRLGIKELLINPGFDFAFVLKREDFFPLDEYKDKHIANSNLHAIAIHFLQNKQIDIENCQKAADDLWKLFIQKLGEGLLLVPMLYEDDKIGDNITDTKLHYTQAAYEIMTNNNIVFWGMTGFDTAPTKEDSKSFKYLTLKASAEGKPDQMWLPAFTDIKEFTSMINKNTRIAVVTTAELNNAAQSYNGICLNPKGINLRLEVVKKQKD